MRNILGVSWLRFWQHGQLSSRMADLMTRKEDREADEELCDWTSLGTDPNGVHV